MKWLRRLFGADFADPVVGQVWRCTRNDEFMRVMKVHTHTSGTIFIHIQRWIPSGDWSGLGPSWGIGDSYAMGLSEWRQQLRAEARVLVGMEYDPRSFRNPQHPPYRLPPSPAPREESCS